MSTWNEVQGEIFAQVLFDVSFAALCISSCPCHERSIRTHTSSPFNVRLGKSRRLQCSSGPPPMIRRIAVCRGPTEAKGIAFSDDDCFSHAQVGLLVHRLDTLPSTAQLLLPQADSVVSSADGKDVAA
jgi:hypothetical protein